MTTFDYTRDIPASGHNPSTDQPNMNINTNSIDDLIDIDHYSFNQANGGKHTQVQLPVLSVIPVVAVAGQGTLYTKANAGTNTDLYYTSNASGVEIQMTRYQNAQSATLGATPIGWSFLPGGLMIQYGVSTSSGTGLPNATVTLPLSNITPISVNCTINTTVNSRFFVEVFSIASGSFTASVRDSSGAPIDGVEFYWQVIGK